MHFVAVEDLFQLRGHGVQAAGHGGGEEEGSGEDPGVEVDPEQECAEPAGIRGRRSVRDRLERRVLRPGRAPGQEGHGWVFQSIGRRHRSPVGASGHGAAERGAVPTLGVGGQHEATRAGGVGPGRFVWFVAG